MNKARWCAKRQGDFWCSIKPNKRPAEGAFSIATGCGHHIILPYGFDRREPTCTDCRLALRIAHADNPVTATHTSPAAQ